ncbi:hypothetical protein ABBQ38_001414 [Trebouxia sp. C0009 RCD-2024]
MDRAHRIGQKKEVQVFRFCTEGSIEEKVIEKALKKLKLDAMIIQQGRLSDNKASVNKDDLLSMVRYGAEMVFSGGGGTITDEDIDAIIAKGERETNELNNKLAQFSENAMKFTMDGGLSAYDYKAEEDAAEADINFKRLAAENWVQPEKRERKQRVNYNQNHYFANAMGAQGGRPSGPRLPKMPQLQDFQFFQVDRLNEIYEKEQAFELHKHTSNQKEAAARAQGASDDVVEAQIAPSPTDPQPLTEEDIQERDQLLEQGFSNWNRRDFTSFVRACERFGRHAIPEITKEIEGKTEEEVRTYSKVFWKRYKELGEDQGEKYIKQIERGEQRIQRQQDIMDAIAAKMDRYRNPWQELKLQYGANKGKAYTEEEDRFILCQVHLLGYGQWDELKAAIRDHWRFRFDWFFKSRTPQELARRCDTLIRLVEKENEEVEAAEQAEKKKSSKKTSGSRATDSSGGAGGTSTKKRKTTSSGGPPSKKRT